MFAVSKKSAEPTTYFALACCVHIVAFVLMAIGMFTPYWTQISEQIGSTQTTDRYDRGLIVSCPQSGECQANTNYTKASDPYFAAFILGILAIIHGFMILQLFATGLFVKSCRGSNLGIPVAIMSISEGILLILVLVLFEISIGHDITPGNIHRDDTFGFSRGLIIGAIVLYLVAAFLIIGEYMRRKDGGTPVEEMSKSSRRRSPVHQRRHWEEYPPDRGRRPPPYV